MYIGSFGHDFLELKLRSSDVYFDIRDDFPSVQAKCRFGINKQIQKSYLKQEGVKELYKKNIYEKVVKKITKRKHNNFRVFIGDKLGAKESVILVERLEKDLFKRHKIMSQIDHITLTASA
jgi:RNase adaptor protein for sRNA GlmZ degradation